MEQALVDLLLATPSITDKVVDRLTPGVLTQGVRGSALVWNIISGERGYSHQGDDGLPRARVQIDAYGDTYLEAKALAEAVMALLSGFSGVVGAVRLTILEARETTAFEHNPGDAKHRRSMDFTIWSRAA